MIDAMWYVRAIALSDIIGQTRQLGKIRSYREEAGRKDD